MLLDLEFGGARKLMVQANRNGFYYVLDRTTGEFLLGKPFASYLGEGHQAMEGRKSCPTPTPLPKAIMSVPASSVRPTGGRLPTILRRDSTTSSRESNVTSSSVCRSPISRAEYGLPAVHSRCLRTTPTERSGPSILGRVS